MTARKQAFEAIETLLDYSLRIRVFTSLRPFWMGKAGMRDVSPAAFSLFITLHMVLLFCVLPAVLGVYATDKPVLLVFAVYGALWAGWSSLTSALASRAILRTIEHRILPWLPEAECAQLKADVERRFSEPRTTLVTVAIGVAAAACAGLLIPSDNAEGTAPGWVALAFWCLEWFVLFAAAASVVRVSTFYQLLPRRIAGGLAPSFRLDPANAALVQGVASVARTMLVFWFGIALSVAVLLPTITWDWAAVFRGSYFSLEEVLDALRDGARPLPSFALIEVPLTIFLSLGYGVIVFLFVEAELRAVARDARLATLERIEEEAGALMARLDTLDEKELKRLADLRALQGSLATSVPYRSIIVSGLSVLLPFLPLITLFLKK